MCIHAHQINPIKLLPTWARAFDNGPVGALEVLVANEWVGDLDTDIHAVVIGRGVVRVILATRSEGSECAGFRKAVPDLTKHAGFLDRDSIFALVVVRAAIRVRIFCSVLVAALARNQEEI